MLEEAYANRSDAIAFVRRIAEAKRDVAKAKGDNGLNATLTARLGLFKKRGDDSQSIPVATGPATGAIEFDIPILDWGRSKSRTKTAQANLQFTQYAVEQDKQILHRKLLRRLPCLT